MEDIEAELEEPELPEIVADFDAEAERPSACEESSSTLLSPQAWAEVESNVASATRAELEELRRKACAEDLQTRLTSRRRCDVASVAWPVR